MLFVALKTKIQIIHTIIAMPIPISNCLKLFCLNFITNKRGVKGSRSSDGEKDTIKSKQLLVQASTAHSHTKLRDFKIM